jgi:ion channel-forming bestrophin family protein
VEDKSPPSQVERSQDVRTFLLHDEKAHIVDDRIFDNHNNEQDLEEVVGSAYYQKTRNNAVIEDPNAEYRYSVSDWIPIIGSIFQSSTLKYTRGPVMAIMMWSIFLCTVQSTLFYLGYQHIVQDYIYTILPSTIAHATTVTILGLLLVFRTTSAYQKFDEGRLIWERILNLCRNITRQVYLYPEFATVKVRIVQLLAAYPYFLHQHVMKKIPTTTFSKQDADIRNAKSFKRTFRSWKDFSLQASSTTTESLRNYNTERKVVSSELPWSLFLQDVDPNNATYNRMIIRQLMQVENRPLYICDEIGTAIASVPFSTTYSSMERMVLLQFLNELTEAVSECERINRTTVPLNYARHSLRGLTVWLFTLPITLLQSYDWWTAPVMGLTAWLYYGIYQIGYVIEDPFQRTIRLKTICDRIYRDVLCSVQRSSAFTVSLSGDDRGEWKDLPL